jgi:hypothetical protein
MMTSTRICVSTFLATLLLLGAAPAWSSPARWQKSFPPRALASYHDAGLTGVIVVRAGERSASLDAAASALRQGYLRSNTFGLVMDDGTLGPVEGLGDHDIVSKAGHLPISHIAVIRVFAGAKNAPATAVVTVYDKAGSVEATFSVKANESLPARAAAKPDPTDAEPEPITIEKTPAPGAAEAVTFGEDARTAYEREFIWFQDVYLTYNYAVTRYSLAFQGRHRTPLQGSQFYRAVGRDDLATRYTIRRRIRLIGILGGTAVTLGGFAYAYLGREDCDAFGGDFNACLDRNQDRFTRGLVIGLVGAGVSAITVFINPHPVSPGKARALVDEHNTALREKLGLPRDHDATPTSLRARPGVQLSSFAGPRGGGLLVHGTF